MSIMSESAAEPVGPYPHARQVGPWLYLSGIGPREKGQESIPGVELDPHGNLVSHDIEVQTHAVVKNVKAVLKASGASLKNVIDVQVFLTNMKQDFKRFNKVYGEYFADIGPTRTTVEVLSLPTPIAVEFKIVAYMGDDLK